MSVPDQIKQLANNVRNAIFGKDVRESIAKSMEVTGETAEETKTRQDSLETQFQSVLDETTGKDVISAPEINAAKVDEKNVTHPSLKARLDDGFNSVNQELAQNVTDRAVKEKEQYHSYYSGAVVSFDFDDAAMSDWTRFKPIFESEGVPGVVAVITSQVGKSDHGYESMSWEQLKELKAMGWTIASHTHRHLRPANMTQEEIDFELRESSRLLREHGLDYDIIVYPFGDVSNGLLEAARKYYKMGVNIVRYQIPNNLPPNIDNLNLGRKPGLSQTLDNGLTPTLDQCKAYVDEAIQKGDYLIFEDHSGLGTYADPAKLEELRQLIQYIKSKGVPIVNAQDGYNMKCNIINAYDSENKYYKLHRNAKVTSTDLTFETTSVSGSAQADKSPYDFPIGKMSVDRITGNASNSNPVYRDTVIRYTNKMVDAPNSWFQEVFSPKGHFIRWYDPETKGWGAFKTINLYDFNEGSSTNYDNPPSFFTTGKVIVDRLWGDVAHADPIYRVPGIRETHKEVDAPNSWFQEITNPIGKFIRFAIDANTWGSFKKIEMGKETTQYRVDITAFSIPANSTVDKILSVPGMLFTDLVTVVPYNYVTLPQGIAPPGVIKTVDNQLTLRFANITGAAISVPGGGWSVTHRHI